MNNRMTYWHLDEDHIDALHPGQRVRHTMNPVMAFSETGQLEVICGTPGGDTQVQTNAQMLVNALDFGYTASECVEAPRWTHYQDGMESTYPHRSAERLRIERRARHIQSRIVIGKSCSTVGAVPCGGAPRGPARGGFGPDCRSTLA